MKQMRMNQMQFLRVLAFFNIYMLHAGHWDIFGYPGWFGAISAVSFFFMLSGFLNGIHFDADRIPCGKKEYLRYIVKKIAGFYPLYFMTTVFAIVFSDIPQAFASGNLERLTLPLIQLAKNLMCIQSWFPEGFLSYNGPCWFSSTLLFLTAMNIPLYHLFKRINCCSKKIPIWVAAVLLPFIGTYLYSYLTRRGDLQYLHYVLPLSRLGIYAGSMALGVFLRPYLKQNKEKSHSCAVFTGAEILSLLFWFASLYLPTREWMEWNAAWILPNALILIVFSFGNGLISRMFSHKALVHLGDVTFECYLIHSLIIPIYSKFNKFDTSYTLGCLFSLATCMFLTVAAALYIHRPKGRHT